MGSARDYIDKETVARYVAAMAHYKTGQPMPVRSFEPWTRVLTRVLGGVARSVAADGHADTARWLSDQLDICTVMMEERLARPGGLEEPMSEREIEFAGTAIAVGEWVDPEAGKVVDLLFPPDIAPGTA